MGEARRHYSPNFSKCLTFFILFSIIAMVMDKMEILKESQKVTFLEKFLHSQQREILIFTLFSITILVLGILLIVFSNAIAGLLSLDKKSFVAIGGTFFSSLSGFPIMTIFKKKRKITAIEFLIGEFKQLQAGGESSKTSSFDFLQERFTKLLDAALGG